LAPDLLYILQLSFKSQFSHKQLVLVNGPCFYRGFSFVLIISPNTHKKNAWILLNFLVAHGFNSGIKSGIIHHWF